MKVEVAKHSGFCFGVRNTIKKIEDTLESTGQTVYSIGLPVHNPQLTERLKEAGLVVVDSASEVKDGILIVRAHGLPPSEIKMLRDKGVEVIDATCPFVKRAQSIATMLSEEGYKVVLCGEQKHPEVKAIIGCLKEGYLICSQVDDIHALSTGDKVALLSQTTYSPLVFQEIVAQVVRKGFREFRIFNTICESVENRKEFAMVLAQQTDVMFIVGGKMSSNTKRLYEAAYIKNHRSYHIETVDEIDIGMFDGATSVGITGGASTPEWLVDEVVSFCEKL